MPEISAAPISNITKCDEQSPIHQAFEKMAAQCTWDLERGKPYLVQGDHKDPLVFFAPSATGNGFFVTNKALEILEPKEVIASLGFMMRKQQPERKQHKDNQRLFQYPLNAALLFGAGADYGFVEPKRMEPIPEDPRPFELQQGDRRTVIKRSGQIAAGLGIGSLLGRAVAGAHNALSSNTAPDYNEDDLRSGQRKMLDWLIENAPEALERATEKKAPGKELGEQLNPKPRSR